MGSWRKKFEERIIDQIEVTERDVIVAGHAHRHFHNKKQKIMLIPSIKTFLRNQQSQNIGCVGLVGFHSEVRTNDWETKIDRMVIPQVLI